MADVLRTRMLKPSHAIPAGGEAVPFLRGVYPLWDHLRIQAAPPAERDAGTPQASFIQATWPITTNPLVRAYCADYCQTDLERSWARTFRLSRFYEALDALTADAAYAHTGGLARGWALVTGGHYHSLKFRRTMPTSDVTLRSYVSKVRRAQRRVTVPPSCPVAHAGTLTLPTLGTLRRRAAGRRSR